MSIYLSRVREHLFQSGLVWVATGFTVLIALNLVSLVLSPSRLLAYLESPAWGPFVSPFIFDSWGTTGGLAGVVVLFTPLLFGVPPAQRKHLCAFFLTASVIVGLGANVLWTYLYDDSGFIGSGSSSIAFAAQGIIFALAIFGLLFLASGHSWTFDAEALDLRWFFSVVYLTLIVSTLYFVLVLQPVFTPSVLYNWRVHEIAFVTALAITSLYELTPRLTTYLVAPNEAK